MKRWIVRTLAVLGGLLIAAAVVLVIVIVPVIRGGLSARDRPSALEARLARAARALSTPAHVRALRNPLQATPEVLNRARAHWADHCATCHANDGSGDTEIGRNLYPKAPDMRAAATQRLTDGELYSIIQGGIRLSGMPAWGDPGVTDDMESWALVAFIRHLPRIGQEEVREMERLGRRGGHRHR